MIKSRNKWLAIIAIVAVVAGVYVWRVRVAGLEPTATPLADDKVQLDTPLPNARVSSPLVIKGRARGTWFFEASFPVILTDWDGKIIAQVPAQAQGDWMTTDWVPFEATLTFEKPANVGSFSDRGALILKKDNPSGLPQYDDAREITIYFK